MRIGVFLESLPNTGGGFQQALSTVEALTRKGATTHDIVVFTPHQRTRQWLLAHGIDAIRFTNRGLRLLDRWAATVVGNAVLRRLRRLGLRRLGAIWMPCSMTMVLLWCCATNVGIRRSASAITRSSSRCGM